MRSPDELDAILCWIECVLNGEPVSDFALSFPLVRRVQDLVKERDELRLTLALTENDLLEADEI
jgi:hypothetical protein